MADKTTKAPAVKSVKKTKEASEVKTIEQLNNDLVALVAENLESRRSHQMGELVNPHVLTVHRKNIARVHTAIAAAHKEAVKEDK
jgi:ribosomal protein L29